MTTNGNSPHGVAPTLEGPVEARNPNGIKVRGNWCNLSKFHPLDLPDVGTVVRCEMDFKGFLKAIEILESPTPRSEKASGRDATITRLSVLKSAAVFLGQMSQTREDVRSDHVLILADRWLAWVNNPQKNRSFKMTTTLLPKSYGGTGLTLGELDEMPRRDREAILAGTILTLRERLSDLRHQLAESESMLRDAMLERGATIAEPAPGPSSFPRAAHTTTTSKACPISRRTWSPSSTSAPSSRSAQSSRTRPS